MGIGGKVKKAIFLDRDGTINKLKFNQDLNELEPPHCPEDFEMIEGAVEAIKNLQRNDFLLLSYQISLTMPRERPLLINSKMCIKNLKDS